MLGCFKSLSFRKFKNSNKIKIKWSNKHFKQKQAGNKSENFQFTLNIRFLQHNPNDLKMYIDHYYRRRRRTSFLVQLVYLFLFSINAVYMTRSDLDTDKNIDDNNNNRRNDYERENRNVYNDTSNDNSRQDNSGYDLKTSFSFNQKRDRRPFYNIGHMCNSIKKTLDHIGRGANAVEVDITFKSDDIYLFHGYPCDCFRYCWDRELLSDYLRFTRQATTPGSPNYNPRWAILYFDIKLKSLTSEEKYANGKRFANHMASFFFNEIPIRSTIRFIIAISYADDEDFIHGFIHQLKELGLYEPYRHFLGYDIGIERDVDRVQMIWRQLNVTNVWQGEGITNCINPIAGHQLEKLVQLRDSRMNYFSKVYRWTIDLSESLRSVLSYHIDGVMTNHPERVLRIITGDSDFARNYRLATIKDDPFKRIRALPRADGRNWIPKYNRAGRITRAIADFTDSLRYYIRDIFGSIF